MKKVTAAITHQNDFDIKYIKHESSEQPNPLNRLIEKHAEHLEEFSKKILSSCKNLDEKFYEKYQKKIHSQSELINSLRARIEELETDAIVKDQNIKRLRRELDYFPLLYNRYSSSLVGENQDYEDMMNLNWNGSSSHSPSSTTKHDLNSKILQINNLYGNSLRLKQFKFLKNYGINELIEYTKTTNFNSLNKKSKRYINFHIKNRLIQEFQEQNVTLSQDLDEYIKRDIIPELPIGYDNYAMCENSDWFNSLNEIQKSRIRKL
ncbi:hypothetical protein C1645_794852, partial [Glomus cerebriforme]